MFLSVHFQWAWWRNDVLKPLLFLMVLVCHCEFSGRREHLRDLTALYIYSRLVHVIYKQRDFHMCGMHTSLSVPLWPGTSPYSCILRLFATASQVCLSKPMKASHHSSVDDNIQSWVVHLWCTRHPHHLHLDSDSSSPVASPLGQGVFHGAPLWLFQSSTAGT